MKLSSCAPAFLASFLIVGAPAAMITLRLMDLKSKAKVDNG